MAKLMIADENRSMAHMLCKAFVREGHHVLLANPAQLSSGGSASMDLVLIGHRSADSHGWQRFNDWNEIRDRAPAMLYFLDSCQTEGIQWIVKAVNQALEGLKISESRPTVPGAAQDADTLRSGS
jgi:DNA-binding NtrC family response regulator